MMERYLVAGFSHTEIAKMMNLMGEPINRQNLDAHWKNHMDLEKAHLRRIWETRARESMLNVEEVEGTIHTYAGMLEVMAQQGITSIMKGDVEWTPKALLDVMERQAQIEARRESEKLDVFMAEAAAFGAAVKEVCPPEMWEDIVAKFEAKTSAPPALVMAEKDVQEID